MKKRFTLIEIIAVLAVLGILAAIIIPNISSKKEKAMVTQVNSNIPNIQTAMDMYALKNNGKFASVIQPTLENPQVIDFGILYPTYLKSLPDKVLNEYYWVDFMGKVWASTIDAPVDVLQEEESIEWGSKDEVMKYNIYKVSDMNSLGTVSKKKIVMKQFVLNQENIDKFISKTDDKLLISAVDKNGLETAPVGMEYRGVQEDWFKPILKKEGTFTFEISADDTMYWDGFYKIEDKPEGTDIIYEFSVLDENSEYIPFTEDFSSLIPSKSIRMKITMIGHNGKLPSLLDFRLYYHFEYDEQFYKKPQRVIKDDSVEDIYTINPREKVDYITSLDNSGGKPRYEFSDDGISYYPISSFDEIPRNGGKLKVIKEYDDSIVPPPPIVKTRPYNAPVKEVDIVSGDVSNPTLPNNKKPKDEEVLSKEWETVQELVFVSSAADGQIAHWISIDIVDKQPENTRILYRYSTGNGFSWDNFVSDFSKLSDSKMLKVYAILQVKAEHVDKVENPEVISLKVNSSKGVRDLSLVKPTVSVEISKDNNLGRDTISTTSNIIWDYDAFDPQDKKIVEVVWGGDKRDKYETPGTYTVTLKVRNALNYWSDELKYTFDVKDEKPKAIITPNSKEFSTKFPVNLEYTSSFDPDLDGISKAEWGGSYSASGFYTAGTHIVKLRVQDAEGNWSDWTEKTFTVVDSVFYGIDAKALDKNDSTFVAFPDDETVKVYWYGDMTNQVARIYLKTGFGSYTTSSMRMHMFDKDGNRLSFINANTGVMTNEWRVNDDNTGIVNIVIPENAHYFQLKGYDSTNFDVYSIDDFDDKIRPNTVSDLQAVPSYTSMTLNWTNPTDEDFSKVAVYRSGTFLGFSTTGTLTDPTLVSNTSYNYEVYAMDTTGNISDKVTISATTLKPVVTFKGLGAKAFDESITTYEAIGNPNSSPTYNVTWDGDLAGKTVFIKANASGSSSTSRLRILVRNEAGADLTFHNTSGQALTRWDISKNGTMATGYIIIPEGAQRIAINTNYANANIYAIQVVDNPILPNPVTDVTSTIEDTSVQLNWSRETDSTLVAIYKNNEFLKYQTANTFSDTGLTPDTEYTYHIETLNTTGGRSEKIEYKIQTYSNKINLSGGTGGISGEYIYTAPNGVVVTSTAPVYTSSNYYYMAYLFDGKSNVNEHATYWMTNSIGNQELTFDFQEEKNIKAITVYPKTRTDAFSNFRIFASNNNTEWTQLTDWYNTSSATPNGTKVQYTLNDNYRYYKIELTRNSNYGVSLAEVEFFE